MSDETNTGVAEDEKETNALLALLYPEDAAERGAGAAELEDSASVSDDELAGMESVRSLFREMPEEEPSDAVTNKLLAMAAQHAPKPAAESKGIFAWLSETLMPLMAHPGLAAAATLVLVVGVAGTLYVKGGAEMAEPQVSSRSRAPSADNGQAAATPATEETALESSPTTVLNEDEARSEDPSAALAERVKATDAPGEAPLGGLLDDRKLNSPSPSKPDIQNRMSGRKDSAQAAPKRKRKSGKRSSDSLDFGSLGSSKGYGKGGARGGAGSMTGAVDGEANANPEPVTSAPDDRATRTKAPARSEAAPSPKTEPQAPRYAEPPPPPSQGAGGGYADSEDDDLSEGSEKQKKERAPAKKSASALHSQAVAAAKRGDCKRVLSLGDQIRKLDSAYYDRTYLSDSRLKACRTAKKLR